MPLSVGGSDDDSIDGLDDGLLVSDGDLLLSLSSARGIRSFFLSGLSVSSISSSIDGPSISSRSCSIYFEIAGCFLWSISCTVSSSFQLDSVSFLGSSTS